MEYDLTEIAEMLQLNECIFEIVPAKVNGKSIRFPLGLFNLHSRFYLDAPDTFSKYSFEYSIDGTEYSFLDFIDNCILRTRTEWPIDAGLPPLRGVPHTAFPALRISSVSAYNYRNEFPRYLCVLNYAMMTGFNNPSVENLRVALATCFTAWIALINDINIGKTSALHASMGFTGFACKGFPTGHRCVYNHPQYPARKCEGAENSAHDSARVRKMFISAFRHDNYTAFRIRGFGHECAAVVAAIVGEELFAEVHKTVFMYGLGRLELSELKAIENALVDTGPPPAEE